MKSARVLAKGTAMLVLWAGTTACASQECSNLTDCPSELVCSAGGACVDREPLRIRVNDSGRPGLGAGDVDDDDAAGDFDVDSEPVPWTAAEENTRVLGQVGPMAVDAAGTPTFDAWTFIASTPEGAMVVLAGTNAGSLASVLTTPGTRTFATGSLDTEIYGMTCTPSYDEPAEIEVVVSEPNERGEVEVVITETNTASDVTVTTRLTPVPVA